MKPIYIAVGITATLAALAALLIGPQLGFLDPYWGFILRAYWLPLSIHVGIALLTSIVSIYWLARVAGLADLGRRVDLAERDIRRGGGDADLQEALQRGDEGLYPD